MALEATLAVKTKSCYIRTSFENWGAVVSSTESAIICPALCLHLFQKNKSLHSLWFTWGE